MDHDLSDAITREQVCGGAHLETIDAAVVLDLASFDDGVVVEIVVVVRVVVGVVGVVVLGAVEVGDLHDVDEVVGRRVGLRACDQVRRVRVLRGAMVRWLVSRDSRGGKVCYRCG